VNHLARHLQANSPARAFSRVSRGSGKAKIIFATYGTCAPESVFIELPGWWDNEHAYLGVGGGGLVLRRPAVLCPNNPQIRAFDVGTL
jgi:hypothetical protein